MLIRWLFLHEIGIFGLKINDVQEEDYEIVKITHIGFVDTYGIEGLLLLVIPIRTDASFNCFGSNLSL